jgi:hypothetical protein
MVLATWVREKFNNIYMGVRGMFNNILCFCFCSNGILIRYIVIFVLVNFCFRGRPHFFKLMVFGVGTGHPPLVLLLQILSKNISRDQINIVAINVTP